MKGCLSFATQIYLQHLVGAGLNARWHVTGIECQLLDLSEIVNRVSVQHKATHRNQREVFMGPHLRYKASHWDGHTFILIL